MTQTSERLAIDGGTPVTTESFPLGWLGPEDIGDEEIEAVTSVLREKKLFRFIDHENSWCTRLENHFREMTGCRYALGVGGGTAALVSAMAGVGIGDGDEVIIPGYTYIATAAAVLVSGGVPVIAEIDDSMTLDPADFESKITERTKAVVPVHMRGFPCDMDPILEIARKHKLAVIEDVAQACGGFYKGKRLGSFGDANCFSFQQYKLITTGEGGMIITDDPAIFQRAALRHDSAMLFWQPEESDVKAFAGTNFRMNEMEGALGCIQFGRLEGILAKTRAAKNYVRDRIADLPGITLRTSHDPEGECGICLFFLCESGAKAQRFAEALKAEGIPAGSVYDKSIPDRHIYCYWEYLMEKGSPDAHGRPWTSPLHDQSRTYTPDMCPKTLDILGRSIQLDFTQRFEEKHCEWLVEAITKVAHALTD